MWRDFLPRATEVLAAELPHVALEIRETEAGPRLWDAVRAGELDFGIGTEPASRHGLKSEPLFDSTLDCALLPASHPLAKQSQLVPDELSRLPLLWARPDLHPGLLAALLDEVERLGIGSQREFVYSGPHATWIAVASGRGWSPVAHAMTEWAPDGTVALPVHGLRVPLVNSAIWRSDDKRGVLRLVLDALRRFRDAERKPARSRATAGAVRPGRAAAQPEPALPPGIALRHLRACAALHGVGSFGQAAHDLGLSQPALSRQIRDLEREVGAVLCERTARGMQTTPAGAALAADATRILAMADELRAAMVRARRLQEQCVVIGAIEMAGTNPTVHRLVRLSAERLPSLEIVMREFVAGALVDALRDGEVDLALAPLGVVDGHHDTIDHMAFTSDTIDCALLPAGHPLAQRQLLGKDDLAALPFLVVTPQASPDFYARAMHSVAATGIRIGAVLAFDGVQTAWAHIAQGRGWSFGVGRFRSQPPAGCKAVPIEGMALPWGLDLLWRRSERVPAIQELLVIADEVAEGSPPQPRRQARVSGGRKAQASR